jgi:hypothetical protein
MVTKFLSRLSLNIQKSVTSHVDNAYHVAENPARGFGCYFNTKGHL